MNAAVIETENSKLVSEAAERQHTNVSANVYEESNINIAPAVEPMNVEEGGSSEFAEEERESETPNVLCPHCGKGFEKNWLLKRHLDAFHSVITVECEICSKQFSSMKALRDHKRTHKNRLCENCNCEVKVTLTKCLSMPPSHKCDQCDYSTNRKESLTKHTKTHWPKEKNFHCKKCPYSTDRKGHLKEHMKSHSKFECKYCKSKFRSKLTLESPSSIILIWVEGAI